MKKVGDIKVGDHLFDRRGNPTRVLAVYPHKEKRAFKVTLLSGRRFIVCDEHLVPYYDAEDVIRHKPLKDMLDDYTFNSQPGGYGHTFYRYHIPLSGAVDFPEAELPLEPYGLGAFLARSVKRSTLTLECDSRESTWQQRFRDAWGLPDPLVTRTVHGCDYQRFVRSTAADDVRSKLRDLGLLQSDRHERFIPDVYKTASKTQRAKLLKGIVEANRNPYGSYYENRKDKRTASAYSGLDAVRIGRAYILHFQSIRFARDVQELAHSLGHNAILRVEFDYAIMTLHARDKLVDDPYFDKAYNHNKVNEELVTRDAIVDITEVAPRDMTCFTVDNDESLFLINDYIVTHNTLVTLTGLVELAQEGRLAGHILVIAPKRIAVNTWPDEIQKWEHVRGARFEVLAGLTKAKRDKLLDVVPTAPPTIYIINRELIPKLVDRFPKDQWQFPNIVIDEAQSFKGYNSLGFKKLKSIAPYTQRFIELTGTPAPNGLMDIWSLIYLLDGGQRLGANITQFRGTHFIEGRRTPEGYPYEWWLKDGHDKIIHDRIKDVAISMTKADYLDMPDLIHNVIEVDMTTAERKIYNQLKKDKVLPLTNGGAIESANAAVLSGALFQLSNGAIYEDESRTNIIELHKHKLNALEEIVDGSNGEPILCFYWFRHDLVRLQQHFPGGETFTGKPEQLKRWNEKKIPLLFAQPASAGHGLNFQHGGHILVFFCVPRSLELYEQSIARLYRNGQTETVIVHYLKTRGTIEDHVMKTLIDKQYDQNALIDAVKASL